MCGSAWHPFDFLFLSARSLLLESARCNGTRRSFIITDPHLLMVKLDINIYQQKHSNPLFFPPLVGVVLLHGDLDGVVGRPKKFKVSN